MEVTLVMFKADGERREFPLRKSVTTLGRKRTCDLRIPVPSVSREHCQIEVNGKGVILRDLGSSNGTAVNDQRIKQTTLSPGDKVSIGPVHFVVVVDGEPAQVEPVPTTLSPQAAEPQESGALAVTADDEQEEGFDIESIQGEPEQAINVAEDEEESASMAIADDPSDDEDDLALAIEAVQEADDESPDLALDGENAGEESSIRLAEESSDVAAAPPPTPMPDTTQSADDDDEDPFADLALDALSGDGADGQDDAALAELAEAFPDDEDEER